MLNSLRFRLLLTMTIVAVVAVGTIAVLSSRSTAREFQRYLASDIQRDERIVSDFQRSYSKDPTMENLAILVTQLAQTSNQRFIVVDSSDVVKADSGGKLIGQTIKWSETPRFADPNATEVVSESISDTVGLPRANIETDGPGGIQDFRLMPFAVIAEPTASGDSGVGSSTITDSPTSGASSISVPASPGQPAPGHLIIGLLQNRSGTISASSFIDSVNQQLLFGAIVAVLAAVLLTWIFSRRILSQVEALTSAAGKMEKGDLSQRIEVKSKDEIGKLTHAFNSMGVGLSRLEQARRNIVADVAHELRTPVANIRGYLEIMIDGVIQPDLATLESLHGEALLLSRLVEDLQDLELADAGKMKLDRLRIDPTEIIEQAVAATQQAANEKKVALKTTLSADLPAILADPARLEQVVRNLLNNAVTHTPAGGSVDVAAHSLDGEIEVCISDTGTGIPAEHLPFIFDRFYRVDPARRRSTGGAGLGLAIVKELVEMHGGRVRAESVPGHGASFFVTLPVQPQT